MTRGSLRGRIRNLEGQGLPTSGASEPRTAAELAAWLDGERANYLRRGYLKETPAGLEVGELPSPVGHDHSIACLLAALPEAASQGLGRAGNG